ncbi:hypothetical protein ACFWOG_20180 [Kitasatospora sp. NPDC058406]|uniref:hypothetical protein n=1 Tax=Kitasatospora sp. NPDC058406 TaxID=3346483 RepID=UPI0036546281
MEEIFELGRITCPSGDLVIIDGGYLGMWSGDESPAGIDPEQLGVHDQAMADDIVRAVDFEIWARRRGCRQVLRPAAGNDAVRRSGVRSRGGGGALRGALP